MDDEVAEDKVQICEGQVERQIVVQVNGVVPDCNLPAGWIGVNHKCGAIVYLHKESRVVTWSRPYCIAKETSLRKHDIPLLSIPCLHQKKTKGKLITGVKRKLPEEDLKLKSKIQKSNVTESEEILNRFEQISNATREDLIQNTESSSKELITNYNHNSSVQNVKDNLVQKDNPSNQTTLEIVDSTEVHTYLSSIFDFEVLSNDYSTKPLYTDAKCKSVQPITSKNAGKKKDGINVDRKSPLQILNEFCQKKLKAPMKFNNIDSGVLQDFVVEVELNNLKYGIGKGDTQKSAKQDAALQTIRILDQNLIPENDKKSYFELFDELPIQDPSIYHTIKDMESPSELEQPYFVLFKLFKRHYSDLQESDIYFVVTEVRKKRYQYEMRYQHYTAVGTCRKRKHAKNLASQNIIQQMYPTLKHWGSVIRLSNAYLPITNKEIKIQDRKIEVNRSEALINALKTEMRKMT
ncbi:microprocessor complex subunit DGCR8-like [Hydractinia symbiolongicarpus]|uniref:microprocessor complex subunit DGCR8-like n=1 Tax=Hydractinia symbiolongicarpus TaxID=13093 RepID=UPI00254F5278|nr:microprocessor complex subunit DGCR8-like [Hydractinia symbiolongicarpus]